MHRHFIKQKAQYSYEKSRSIIQILDPSDYSAVDLEMKDEFADYNIGDEIKLIKINDYIYLLN